MVTLRMAMRLAFGSGDSDSMLMEYEVVMDSWRSLVSSFGKNCRKTASTRSAIDVISVVADTIARIASPALFSATSDSNSSAFLQEIN